MKFNASLIKTWMSCPLQARFKEIEKRPYSQGAKQTFGTCIHEALELYNQYGDLNSATERFKLTWGDPSILGCVPEYWQKTLTFGGLRKKGIEILSLYDEKNKWSSRNVVAAEHKFCVPFGEHTLSGIVDLVEFKKSPKGNSQLRIVDYKTNTKQPYASDLHMDIQFTAYVYASLQPEFWLGYEPEISKYSPMENGEKLMNTFSGIERRAIWYHLWGNKEIDAGPRDDGDFMRLYRVCDEIANAVEKEVYVPNISGSSCIWCDYVDICKVTIPIHDKIGKTVEEYENEKEIGVTIA